MFDLRNIPSKDTNFSFLKEVDFDKLLVLIQEEKIVRPAGREDDIESIRLALMSANANSVWLQGEEGVGKSAIVGGLLQKIANKEVGPSLLSRRFFIFQAHAFFKIKAEDQFAQFDNALVFLNSQHSVLIFDRIDDFISTANGDAHFYANALIDSLHDTQAIIISQSKSKDIVHEASTGFLATFVEKIIFAPKKDDLLYMLRANRHLLEEEHDVVIPEETLKEAVRILDRYPARAFTAPWPQGPLDLLDKTAAYVRMCCYNLSPVIMKKTERFLQLKDEKLSIERSAHPSSKRIEEISNEMSLLNAEIEPARNAWKEKFEPYTKILNEIAKTETDISRFSSDPLSPAIKGELSSLKSLLIKLKKREVEIASSLHADKAVVSRADIQKVFANASGLNLSDISGDERTRLLNAENEMRKTVFGQDAALTATADILRAGRSGVADPTRPAGVILYTGPSGTGKTELSKALATLDGGEGSKPVIFAMNKYKDQSAVSEFRGPSPGLVGYNEEGPPTLRAIRQNSRCVVLFDEIEKANEEIYDVIMTITDEGNIDDSAGNPVSFKDAILIFTTNVLLPNEIDYGDATDADSRLEKLRAAVKAKINPKTGRPYFRPEFIERIDMIVMFNNLGVDTAKSILRKQISDQNKTLEARNYKLTIDDTAIDEIVGKHFKEGSNGRTVRQFYNRIIRPQITFFLLRDTSPPAENDDAKHISIVFVDGEVSLR